MSKWNRMRGGAQCIHLSPEGQAILSSRELTRLRRRVHKGIPEPLRALSWKVMSGAGELAEQRRNEYRELKKRVLAGEVPEATYATLLSLRAAIAAGSVV